MPQEQAVLNRVNVLDVYDESLTIRAPGTKRFTVFVYNNSVLYQLATDLNGQSWSLIESELPPGFHSFAREASGIRFREFSAGGGAIVTAKALS